MCAHPTHFELELRDAGDWTSRVRGVRANASKRSHAELDGCSSGRLTDMGLGP